MSIREINMIGDDYMTIVTTDNHVKTFKKEKLTPVQKVWFENVIACSISLMNETPTK